jgi:hypothetical protein
MRGRALTGDSPKMRTRPEVGFRRPRFQEADDELDQGRLAAAVGPDDACKVTGGDLEVDVLEHQRTAVEVEAQVFHLNDRCGLLLGVHFSAPAIRSAMVSRLAR